MKWNHEPIKSLGIYFGYDRLKCLLLNWEKKIERLKTVLNQWSRRKLSLYGKITVLKSLALPQIFYLLLTLSAPHYCLKQVNNLIFKFVWNNKPDKIKRQTLIGPYEYGGLKIPDIFTIQEAFCASWIRRLCDPSTAHWKALPLHWLSYYGHDFLIFHFNFRNVSNFPFLDRIPEFYKQVIVAWHKAGGGCVNLPKPSHLGIRNQIIWGNINLSNKGKTLFYQNWIQSNIIYVHDILDENGDFLSPNLLLQKLKSTSNWISEWKQLLSFFPSDWKTILKGTRLNQLCRLWNFFYVNGKAYFLPKDLSQFTSKFFYNILLNKRFIHPYCEETWNRHLKVYTPLQWKIIWISQTISISKDRKFAEFNFKILHNILPCGKNLLKWKLSKNDQCCLCNVTDSYEHLFLNCRRLGNFWQRFSTLLNKLNIQHQVNLHTIIFGYKSLHNHPVYRFVNFIITIAKYCVFCSWVHMRHDLNSPKASTSFEIFYKYLNFMYQMYKINEHAEFTIYWKKLLT